MKSSRPASPFFYLTLCVFLSSVFFPGGVDAKPSAVSLDPPKCHLEILQVLEATVDRGPPYLVRILEKDPEHAGRISAESHGDHHLSCTYEVLMNSRRYRYREEFSDTLLQLKESDCSNPATEKKVREMILQFTQECRNPEA